MHSTFNDSAEPIRASSNSIDKTLSVIDCIFEEEGTFIDIQKKLNLPKATLHRILQSLEKYELIEKVPPTDYYRLGLKFIYYSEVVKTRLSIPSVAQSFLQSLSASIRETAGLSVLYQDPAFLSRRGIRFDI